MPNHELPRLLADAMLGKLARWLRALGYDTLYLRGDDATIANRARADNRVLLTRDRELSHRRGLSVVLVASQTVPEQLEQVLRAVGLPPEGCSPRCMECNGVLVRIPHEIASSQVPVYVAGTQDMFHQCSKCGRIYWKGTHWDGIERQIRQALMDSVRRDSG
jgi:uncharacterized protein with PIN domain